MQLASSPYEQFLRQSIEEQKVERDKLFNEFARANPVKKQLLKRKIEEINQNLALISADLEKYVEGLEWLREPSKERDEKAEHLPKLAKEEAAAPVPTAAPGASGAPKPGVTRPTIGKPIGSAPGQPVVAKPPVAGATRPTIGTPVGRPQIGSPVGTPKPEAAKPNQAPVASTPVARPTIGTPVSGVKRPVIGTPIGTPKTETPAPPKPTEKKYTEEDQASNSSAESTSSS